MCLREAFIGIFLPLFVHVRIETSVCTFGVFSHSVFLLLFAEGLKRIDKLNCWKLEFCRKQLFKQTETVFTRANKPLQNIFSGISLFCIWHPLEFNFFFFNLYSCDALDSKDFSLIYTCKREFTRNENFLLVKGTDLGSVKLHLKWTLRK